MYLPDASSISLTMFAPRRWKDFIFYWQPLWFFMFATAFLFSISFVYSFFLALLSSLLIYLLCGTMIKKTLEALLSSFFFPSITFTLKINKGLGTKETKIFTQYTIDIGLWTLSFRLSFRRYWFTSCVVQWLRRHLKLAVFIIFCAQKKEWLRLLITQNIYFK